MTILRQCLFLWRIRSSNLLMVPERALSVPNASGTYRFDNRFLESRARPAKDGIPVREFPGFGNRASQKFQA